DYQAAWLDDCLANGQWLWIGQGEPGEASAASAVEICFLQREHLAEMPLPAANEISEETTSRVLECLRTRGALFVPDMASQTGLPPGAIRSSLWGLVRRGWVTNDRFDPIRRGEQNAVQSSPANLGSLMRGRRRAPAVPEGRWSLVPWGRPDT